jgi:hypothetical protein
LGDVQRSLFSGLVNHVFHLLAAPKHDGSNAQ